jgi:phosphatidylinositol alpha-1,6-mannosyltransferase
VTRTLLLAYDFPPRSGGIARCLAEIARHQKEGELVVSTGAAPGADSSGLNVDRVPVPIERLRTLSGLRRWGARVVELHDAGPMSFTWVGNLKPAGYPAHWLRARRGVPYGVMLYGLDLLLLERQIGRSPVKRAIARRLLGGASATVAISSWTAARAQRLRSTLGLEAGEVAIVPLGADPDRFHPGADAEPLRARLGLAGRRWMLTVARLEPHKGIDTGLRVLAALRDELPDLGYMVAGAGPLGDSLAADAERLGLADRFRLLGQVSEADLPALYRAASLYLGLSREMSLAVEGFGLSLVEAGASGLVVVAGRSGGIPDTVRDGETGLLVNPDSVDDAAAAVRAILADQNLARRLSESGRREVERYFNWNRVTTDLRAIQETVRPQAAPAAR